MVQKTVLKVDICCEKCKQQLLKAVSSLQGVDKMEADAAKGTLTVIGEADPYDIIMQARKAGKYAQFVSVGPPPKPEEKKEPQKKKEPEKKSPCSCPGPIGPTLAPGPCFSSCSGCMLCRPVAVMTLEYPPDPVPSCSIM